MAALKFFYRDLGDRLWGVYGRTTPSTSRVIGSRLYTGTGPGAHCSDGRELSNRRCLEDVYVQSGDTTDARQDRIRTG